MQFMRFIFGFEFQLFKDRIAVVSNHERKNTVLWQLKAQVNKNAF